MNGFVTFHRVAPADAMESNKYPHTRIVLISSGRIPGFLKSHSYCGEVVISRNEITRIEDRSFRTCKIRTKGETFTCMDGSAQDVLHYIYGVENPEKTDG